MRHSPDPGLSAVGASSSAAARPATVLLLALLLLAPASSAHAQWPAELEGRVVDAVTGTSVSGARVRVRNSGRAAESDGDGRFRLRGLEPGTVTLVATALGYGESVRRVRVRTGTVSRARIVLSPRALPLSGLTVSSPGPDPGAGARVLERSEVEESGARTVGELLRGVAGVTVRARGPGGREEIRIRGDDAVLVLVDGAPINDPVTGGSDLSTLSTASVRRVTVIRGARSARFGPGAQGGVVLVETGSVADRPEAGVRVGSLGRRGGELRAGGRVAGVSLEAGAEYETLDGRFRFHRAEEAGGGAEVRRNADRERLGAHAAGRLPLLDGRLRVRAAYEEVERALPGKSFAPSDSARERHRRERAGVSWRVRSDSVDASVGGYLIRQRLRVRDPDPPLGPPYDDRTEMTEGGLRARASVVPGWGIPAPELAAGMELTRQSVRSGSLSSGASRPRTEIGVWIRGEAEPGGSDLVPRITATLRAHRSGPGGRWYGSHELSLRSRTGPLLLHLSHRSAFTPPTLGDQFFREGVAVRPNPDLRAERIPSELEAGVTYRDRIGPVALELAATGFTGDVRDMIVWAPDFRFVWSPRNVDVERAGLELRGSLGLPRAGVRLAGSFSRARSVYDRSGGSDVQLRYRPRHTASLSAEWSHGGLRTALHGRYVGRRTTAPTRANMLPGFWTADLDVRNRWCWAGWELDAGLRVDRILDRTDPFIFAFPEPGRTLRLTLDVRAPRP